ncbi:MAG: hypothetical protein AB1760_13445 [Pseudomonadota bacterium]
MTRTISRFIPQASRKVAHKNSDAVAYLYELNGRPCAVAYVGRQSKPVLFHRFTSEASRARAIADLFAGRERALAYKAERAAARRAPHKLQVGHILVSSWGYDQTNIDWYQVTAVVGDHTVEIRPIASNLVEGAGGDRGRCFPRADVFTGEARRVRVSQDSVRVSNCAHASLWDGRGRYWSSYH